MNTQNSINYQKGCRNKRDIVIIKGMYCSDKCLLPLIGKFEEHNISIIDLHNYCKDVENLTLSTLTSSIKDDIDKLNIKNAIFISMDVGNLVSIKLGQMSKDTIDFQFFLGAMSKITDSQLLEIQNEIFSLAANNKSEESYLELLSLLVTGGKVHDKNILFNIKQLLENGYSESLRKLLNLYSRNSISPQDLHTHVIPNHVLGLKYEGNYINSAAIDFSRKIGANKRFLEIEGIPSYTALIGNLKYLDYFKRTIMEFCSSQKIIKDRQAEAKILRFMPHYPKDNLRALFAC